MPAPRPTSAQTPYTPDSLAVLLDVDFEAGLLFWKPRPLKFCASPASMRMFNSQYAGTRALTAVRKDGYLHGQVLGRYFVAHRVIMAMHLGKWPEQEIDHINGVRTDNGIANLRLVDRQMNSMNTGRRSDNMSGVTGVGWHKQRGMWHARIKHGGKMRSLGLFEDLADAVDARARAQDELGFHANHGR